MKYSFIVSPLLLIYISFLLNSCNLATKYYYVYTANDGYNENYFLWVDSTKCGLTINNTSLHFDELKIYFPSNQSSIQAYCETYLKYVDNNMGEIVDSVETCDWYFDLNENDLRVEENPYTLLYITQQNTTILLDTLYRKRNQLTWFDRIPLPKLH